MNSKTSRIIILLSAAFTLALLVYAIFFSGRQLKTLQQQLDARLTQVEACYPLAIDSLTRLTPEGRQIQQVNDTISAYLALYRQQLAIASGQASVPEEAAGNVTAWRRYQLLRLTSLQKSTSTLVTFLAHQGIKQGHTEYELLSSEAKQQARDCIQLKTEAAHQQFSDAAYLAPDTLYFTYLEQTAEMFQARLNHLTEK